MGIRGYVLSTTVANLATTLGLVWKARLWRYVQFVPKSRLRRQMLRYCIPLIPTAIFWWVMGVSDRYMVKWFLGSDANGIYAVAYKIPTILTILASIFMDAWQLSAIAESSGDRRAHLRFYGRIWDLFAADVFLGAGGIVALSPLLIAGVYLPTIQAVHSFLRLQLDVVPGLCALGFGVIAGVGLSIHAIRAALRSCRGHMVWLILGLMLGSLYAIANGPASLDTPLPPLDAATFQLPAFLLGTAILLALEGLKKATKRREQANGALQKGENTT